MNPGSDILYPSPDSRTSEGPFLRESDGPGSTEPGTKELMAFQGKLTEFRLPDLLQMVSSTGKSGKLRLTRRDAEGVIVFREGKIIYAATSSVRQTLGGALMAEGLIPEEELTRALEKQHSSRREKRLGNILVERGAITHDDLDRVIREQFWRVIAELIRWPSGFFKFDLMKLPDRGEVAVDAQEFLHEEGVGTEHVLLDIVTKLDELEKEQSEARAAEEAESPPVDEQVSEPEEERGRPSLKGIMAEIRSPRFTGEFTHKILSYAEGLMRRGALFLVRQRVFSSVGHFGFDQAAASGTDAQHEITVPLDEPSVLTVAMERNETIRGPLEETPAELKLLEELGGGPPGEAVAIPLMVNGRAVLVFYADNFPGNAAIQGVNDLEVLILQIGLAMEKSLLEKRIEHFEALRYGSSD